MGEPGYNLVTAGKVTGCYGVKGWVKVHSYTDPAENIAELGKWRLKRHGALEAFEVDQWKRHGKGMVAHIAGVDDRNLAETFKGLEIMVPADSLPGLEEGDYYWRDLQGLQVWGREPGSEEQRVLLGEVDYLIETGANDVLVVKATSGSIDETERLIPYLPGDVVTRVSLEDGIIEVDWYLDA
jgi:16S rRNA processing protein RimM